MSEALHLAEAVEGLFARPDHGWFTCFLVATEGLTAAQAASIPAKRFNSIWAVTNHVRFWQEFALLRLRGMEVNREELGAENGWPPAGEPLDEPGWLAERERALAANRDLAAFVAAISDKLIGQPVQAGRASRYQIIQGIIAHNSYHSCEIISIRHMLGLWLERT